MNRRTCTAVAALLMTLGPAATAVADSGSGSGGDTDDRVRYICDITAPCPAGDAGSVTIARDGDVLSVTSVQANEGWTFSIGTDDHPQVTFRTDGTSVKFQAEIEDGEVEVKVRTRLSGDDNGGGSGGGGGGGSDDDNGGSGGGGGGGDDDGSSSGHGDSDIRERYVCDITLPCPAGEAGSVTLARDGAVLTIVSVQANEGWTYSIDDDEDGDDHPEVKFRKDGAKVKFAAEVEDDEVRVKVRTRNGSSGGSGSGGDSGHGDSDIRERYVCDITLPCPAGEAGSVTLARDGAVLTIVSVQANEGWTYSIDDDDDGDDHPEVKFRKDGAKVKFAAEVEDGEVRVKVRTRIR